MNIVLNGNKYEHTGSGTLTALMSALNIDSQSVAIMINENIISRDDRASVAISEGDRVEIVTCAPGG